LFYGAVWRMDAMSQCEVEKIGTCQNHVVRVGVMSLYTSKTAVENNK
jgi:hypothetical protein